ncbi:hypothetical protein BDN72DRAFT_898457 [Pluteus cervinus]|uniref:Uncharacterized protein n=1 Tax=Pluteus cervinus TaxID=181527 RepID=A0ACD3AR72_9AGAR|nr:hypothetical protein BDN72DRAFT_898457 [Pluteus cervinus]
MTIQDVSSGATRLNLPRKKPSMTFSILLRSMNKFVALLSIVLAAQQVSGQAVEWGQCGGINWTGAKTCASGLVCNYVNDYYYQCIKGTAPTTAPTQAPTTRPTSSPTSSPPQPTGNPGTGLNGKFVAKGKKFWGSCADSNTLNIASNANILKAEIGALTPVRRAFS